MKKEDVFPGLIWLRSYKKTWISKDIIAGLTIGVMIIPQGLAYALIAGLPPIYGLYTSIIPLLIYAVFGSSKYLSVGPVAMVSILVGAAVFPYADQGSEVIIGIAITLSFLIGLMQVAMGVFRLGFIVNFLSHPVLSGFTSAAAIIIAFSQLKNVFGLDIKSSKFIHDIIFFIFNNLSLIHIPSLLISLLSLGMIILIKKWNANFPSFLLVVVLGISLVYTGDLHMKGISVVGQIPAGLPEISVPIWSIMVELLPVAFSIGLIGFIESIAIAKKLAEKNERSSIDSNKELIGMGMANFGGSFFSAYPVAGGFSRSIVNKEAGAKSQLSSIIAAFMVILTLLFFTDIIFYLPEPVLASIVIVAVIGLVDFKEPVRLLRLSKADFTIWGATFILTLTMGIMYGILLGALISLILILLRTTQPHFVELGRLPGTPIFRNIKRYNECELEENYLVVRFDGPLYFANHNYFVEKMQKMIAGRKNLKFIVLDAAGISHIDSTAFEMLEEFDNELKEDGIKLLITSLIGPVRDKMNKAGLIEKLGENRFYMEVFEAITATREMEAGEKYHLKFDPLQSKYHKHQVESDDFHNLDSSK